MSFRNTIFRAAMNALYFSGAHRVLRPLLGGVGAILTLHHVRPPRPDRFQPNRLLEVTPKFFERVIRKLRRSGIDLVSLDELHRRMTRAISARRFVCVTFDDGYRDTHEFAYPILKAYDVPFAVYVATGFADRLGEMWWLALEAVIAQNDMIACASTAATSGSSAAASSRSARCSTRSTGGCAASTPRRSCARWCARWRAPQGRLVAFCKRALHGLGGDSARSPPIRW